MKSAFWRSIAVVALVAAPMMANANDATIGSEVAYWSMFGGSLQNTTAIFNAYPHMVVENGTGAELNTLGDGFGQVWWEAYDNLWLTMDVGRMDYGMSGTTFMWLDNPFSDDNDIFADYSMVNLGIAKPLAGGGAFAVGVQFAPFGGNERTGGAPEFENNYTGYGVNGSWTNGDGFHVGGEFAMTKYEDVDNTNDETDEYEDMGFGVLFRYDTDLYIYQGSAYFVSGTDSGDNFAEDVDTSDMGFLVSAGRYLKNEVDGQTSVEFGFSYQSDKEEIGSAEDKNSEFLIPAVRVSSWEKISDRFGLMGGAGWGHSFDTSDDGTIEFNDNEGSFGWMAGLFFQPSDNVRVDGMFIPSNLNKIASAGNDSPLVAYLGLTVGLN